MGLQAQRRLIGIGCAEQQHGGDFLRLAPVGQQQRLHRKAFMMGEAAAQRRAVGGPGFFRRGGGVGAPGARVDLPLD